ncbi:hypothetical protein FOA52_001879 [Chlamydomonas sp. UWO 241]|nr:hypothetical protein FOA52_001879 [Chlamydomonas sp. UWO 241]
MAQTHMPAALGAYRGLLRAIHKTFVGDKFAMSKMYGEARGQFEVHRALVGEAEVTQRIADAHEARAFILESVVQAKKSSCNSFEVSDKDAQRMKDKEGPSSSNSNQ